MLHRNITAVTTLRGGLDDLVADLRHARKQGDLSRLALVAYCEVRRWARLAGETELAEQASAMITEAPHANRQEFLARIDALIDGLEAAQTRFPDDARPRTTADEAWPS